ncbi:MAG: type II toxin-antitoxin system VapC family toxin [Pseudonocardiaceae bacterium]
MIYLDSCALVKLVREEESSNALQDWLDERADELQLTSAVARAELLRAIRRNNYTEAGNLIDADALEAELTEAAEVLAAVAHLAVDDEVLDRAGGINAPTIRTLDAIYLSSAAEFDPSDVAFVTYDRRLAAAATGAGLAVVAPTDQDGTGENSSAT